ncbi:amino acid transporter [Gottfriedia sp. NPDC057991]|uniref:amino acid transporter n=1 Tax=Gottfriedia sp. NPDC057991 TaxID=3346298 RepID=UPI0036DCAA5D
MKEENKPFNDVIDHFNKIEGNAANAFNKETVKGLPKPIKYIGYFFAGFLSISILLIFILNLLH